MKPTKAEVRRIVESMTLDQKVGQCLTFGFSGGIVTDDFIECFERFHCGGLRLSPYSNNFEYKVKSKKAFPYEDDPEYARSGEKMLPVSFAPYLMPAQYAGLIDRFQSLAMKHNCGAPLHISVDQEGDMSADIVRGGVALFASQMGMAATRDPRLAQRAAGAIARQLKNHGVNMTHAPVLDVNALPDNIEVDTRSFSDKPRMCAEYGLAMMRGYQNAGLIATGKHFPGRGNSNLDAHDAIPTVEGSAKEFEKRDFVPFRALIDNGLDAVMLAHSVYPGLDPSGALATLSPKIVTGILRKRLGFKGVITTDSITMAALVKKYGIADGAVLALKAGVDLVLMKEETKSRGEMFFTIKKYVEKGEIPLDQLNASVARILALKAKRGLFGASPAAPKAARSFPDAKAYDLARKVALRSMIVAKNADRVIPLRKGCRVYLIEQVFFDRSPNDAWNHPRKLYETLIRGGVSVPCRSEIAYADAAMGGKGKDHVAADALEYADRPDYDVILVTSFFYRNYLTDPDIVRGIIRRARTPVLVVTNTPYRTGYVREARNEIINFTTSPAGFDALTDVLLGKRKHGGRLPVSARLFER